VTSWCCGCDGACVRRCLTRRLRHHRRRHRRTTSRLPIRCVLGPDLHRRPGPGRRLRSCVVPFRDRRGDGDGVRLPRPHRLRPSPSAKSQRRNPTTHPVPSRHRSPRGRLQEQPPCANATGWSWACLRPWARERPKQGLQPVAPQVRKRGERLERASRVPVRVPERSRRWVKWCCPRSKRVPRRSETVHTRFPAFSSVVTRGDGSLVVAADNSGGGAWRVYPPAAKADASVAW